MRFTRIVFGVAAVYGFLSLPPLYFLRDLVGRMAPPAINHPEFYYGFVGLALLWQFVFVLVALDPVSYRAIIPIAVLEKLAYAVPVVLLYSAGDLRPSLLGPGLVDPIFGVLFSIGYFRIHPLRIPEFSSRRGDQDR